MLDTLEIKPAKFGKHLAGKGVDPRAYDLTNLVDTYTLEYGSPPDLTAYSDSASYAWLVSMCALPSTVRRVKGDGRLVLVGPFGCAPSLLCQVTRQLRARVVSSLLEYVPSVRHLLGQLPGKTQHHVGANYITTLPCKTVRLLPRLSRCLLQCLASLSLLCPARRCASCLARCVACYSVWLSFACGVWRAVERV